MKPYGGYMFIIDEPQRASVLEEYVYEDWSFTDTISAPDWGAKRIETFLVSLDGQAIHHAALVRRGNMVATRKHRIRFSNFVLFEPPIRFSEIHDQLRPQATRHFVRSSSGRGSRVPPKTWEELLKVIKRLRPTSARDLDRLEQLRQLRPEIMGWGGAVIAQERDAVNLALRASGFDDREILKWQPPEDELAPFVRGLPEVRLTEDQMIIHDTQVFGDWGRLSPYHVGTIRFHKHGEQLTIMNVNRHKVEETLGVDLLYYHHRYRSYVMVQYKRMIRETNEPMYRPIDKNYRTELQRMQDFEKVLIPTGVSVKPGMVEYRLNPRFFYFKLCPADRIDPTSTEMIRGMYIPLGYWEILVESPATSGPRGGQRITYENTGRHFNNTLFIELVQEGWIGSRTTDTHVITEVILNAIEGKRSVILASKESNDRS